MHVTYLSLLRIWRCFVPVLFLQAINMSMQSIIVLIFTSSHQRCSVKKAVLRNFAKFTGKHLCQSLFFNKVAGGWNMNWQIIVRFYFRWHFTWCKRWGKPVHLWNRNCFHLKSTFEKRRERRQNKNRNVAVLSVEPVTYDET